MATVESAVTYVFGKANAKYWGFGFAYLVWLGTGTVFYKVYLGYDWDIAYFHAIDVGYGVGWCYDEIGNGDQFGKFFSVTFMAIGVIIIFVMLVFIADIIVTGSEKWFLIYVKRRIAEPYPDATLLDQLDEFYETYFYPVTWGMLTMLTIIVGAGISCYIIGWTILDGVFFSLSCMTASGLFGIPYSSPSYAFFLAGTFVIISAAVTLISLSYIGKSIYITLTSNHAEVVMDQPVSVEELKFLSRLGSKSQLASSRGSFGSSGRGGGINTSGFDATATSMSNDSEEILNSDKIDGAIPADKVSGEDDRTPYSREMEIDRLEFILLVIVRLGVVDTGLVKTIQRRFEKISEKIGEESSSHSTDRGLARSLSRRLSLDDILSKSQDVTSRPRSASTTRPNFA